MGAVVALCYLLLAAAAQQNGPPTQKKGSGASGTKSTAHKSTAPAVPAFESDAKAALASQWRQWDPYGSSAHWKMCFSALDLATQAQPKYSDALTVLALGFDGTSKIKEPYAAPAADADVFWDWVAGAARDTVQPDPQPVKDIVDAYYRSDNRGLMEKVDANFSANTPRRAIFELIAYEAPMVRAAETTAVQARKTADASQSMADAMANEAARANSFDVKFTTSLNSQLDPIGNAIADSGQKSADLKKALADYILPIKSAAVGNAAVGSAADQLAQKVSQIADKIASDAKSLSAGTQYAKTALKGAVDSYAKTISDASKAAQTVADANKKMAKATGDAVDALLGKLEAIRVCYASVKQPGDKKDLSCRTALIQYVSGKFHAQSK
jgi:hypothetical protein